VNLLHTYIDQPEEVKSDFGIHEQKEKKDADSLVWEAKYKLQCVKNRVCTDFKHDDTLWAEKVLERCEKIKENIYDCWFELNN